MSGNTRKGKLTCRHLSAKEAAELFGCSSFVFIGKPKTLSQLGTTSRGLPPAALRKEKLAEGGES